MTLFETSTTPLRRQISAPRANRGPRQKRAPDVATIRGGKGGIFYRAHSYHTKVPVDGIVRLIEHYTDPGDYIADPFCGSGQTGVAALLSGRHAVLSDLSPAAVHIARGYTTKVDPAEFSRAGDDLLSKLADLERDLYGPPNERIEYTVWSDEYQCPECAEPILFWDCGVNHDEGSVLKTLHCPLGHGPFKKTNLRWLRTVPVQENLSSPASRKRLVRDVVDAPIDLSSPSDWIPTAPWDEWREMWRSQHKKLNVRTAADFYTPRNLTALAALWREVNLVAPASMSDALRFAFTSIVNRASRRYQWHPSRPTNVLSSTMYIASLSYEFNVFSLLRRKLATLRKMYETTWSSPGSCTVEQGSADNLGLIPDGSIDYVFTDPPFGSNIYYGDSSFLWEAWLGAHTDLAAEAVVNRRLTDDLGRTDLDGYREIMTNSMREISRILRPNGWVSLQFHNSDDAVWSSVQSAVENANLQVATAVVMDKGQASFKGLRHASRGERVANFDLVMHIEPRLATASTSTPRPKKSGEEIAQELRGWLADQPPSRRTTPWIHSQVMRFLLDNGSDLDGWSFEAVERLCDMNFDREGKTWNVRD